jgi:tRNA-splicing ligase RtcB
MLHSGSRGIGNQIGKYFIELARQDMRKWFINLPDKDLAYIPEGTEHFNDYIDAVGWAQNYAWHNRQCMLELIIKAMERYLPSFKVIDEVVNCHHNYVAHENHFGSNVYVTRKGAIRAREGEYGIIPGSMGAKSFIVKGKGNKESFCSCSHGAGRKMSRTEAEKKFTKADLEQQTDGVMCRKDTGVLDEIPGAYKDIDEVMNNQLDLVDVVHTLKQIMCIKG